MALNIFDISILCPIKLRDRNYVQPGNYHTRFFDEWNYADTLKSFDEPRPYYQPWEQADPIPIQIFSNFAPHQIEIYNCSGDRVGPAIPMVFKNTSMSPNGLNCFEANIPMDDYPEGRYQFVFKSGDPQLITGESEWFDLRASHPDTILLEYSHDENDFDVAFETGIILKLRTYGFIAEYQPVVNQTLFVDSEGNSYLLSSDTSATWKLFIGDEFGVPDYMIEKINLIYRCNKVLHDGKQFRGNEGARFEAKRESQFPLTGWSFDLRPAFNSTKKRLQAEGVQAGDTLMVVYNIQRRMIGGVEIPASASLIQIPSLD